MWQTATGLETFYLAASVKLSNHLSEDKNSNQSLQNRLPCDETKREFTSFSVFTVVKLISGKTREKQEKMCMKLKIG
jgi:hypothetical protein